MTILEALILGLLQGITEFLPVSSSGHLAIAQHFLGVDTDSAAQLTFGILVHAATVMATITVFARELGKLATGTLKFKNNPETQYVIRIAVSMIPILIIGLFFKDYVEAIFGSSIYLVASMLLVTAALLTFSYFFTPKQAHEITKRDAFIIGLAQAVAVLPGLSRSGSTIATGMMLGVEKQQLAKFSFLMVLIPILGEAFLELIKGDFAPAQSGLSVAAMATGFVAAYVAGLFACKVMIKLVAKGKLYYFAIYCAILAFIIFFFS